MPLTYLSLVGCEGISDAGLAVLSSSVSLKALDLPGFAKITDRGIETLSASSIPLEKLWIDHLTGVTDAGVRALAKLKSLQRVQLSGLPNVTSEAVEYLKAVAPSIDVHVG